MSSQIVAAAVALILFVITQGILKFIIEPIHEQKKLIGEVANALLFYANVVHLDTWGPPDEERRREMDEARRTLRGLAGRLRESLWTVTFYDTLALLGRVPKKKDVLEAALSSLDGPTPCTAGARDTKNVGRSLPTGWASPRSSASSTSPSSPTFRESGFSEVRIAPV